MASIEFEPDKHMRVVFTFADQSFAVNLTISMMECLVEGTMHHTTFEDKDSRIVFGKSCYLELLCKFPSDTLGTIPTKDLTFNARIPFNIQDFANAYNLHRVRYLKKLMAHFMKTPDRLVTIKGMFDDVQRFRELCQQAPSLVKKAKKSSADLKGPAIKIRYLVSKACVELTLLGGTEEIPTVLFTRAFANPASTIHAPNIRICVKSDVFSSYEFGTMSLSKLFEYWPKFDLRAVQKECADIVARVKVQATRSKTLTQLYSKSMTC